ncbi:5-dehydro-4-deoxyglucarate dehydratase [Rhodococcus jostii RHA1]|jgi:5-dehydro-4-deoxyglucarate dehydratase|uniref:Probable 5-dehydro-4-deoxyglucarate dehydratase n=1 Tax=Rhodococcus jostii (strain RHA1) TaxID=101510 RepID=KDGD_RHOJR|nr:5-dehydro-4-deoxyglucarate dehydratase [Rhodococcus jostii]Q0SBH9.1 RecName: Full=Probable 5-dehydro-4-deoxyglucarate dehydratase; AltName: Full=5-keto-4-deoxy-glucarate dehydratase; Short=KDGDH [Rhodococcus jostii RHA1]ABG95107.1 5-dehydro-4-deoxyglucarate dehydratase [Rhodococcus jostii RHA1]
MATASPHEIAHKLGSGLLSFPVTHFKDDHSFDEAAYRENIGWLGQFDASGLFAAGGTGEFFSLTPPEVEQVVRAAVQEAPDGLPVIAPAGYGTSTAVQMARSAESVGAHGILLLPPYLTEASQDGLVAHVKEVCAATTLGVTIYSRANAVYTEAAVAELADSCPNLVGFKDGVGNIEQMTRIYASLGDRLTYIGGLPTAEMFALPYLALGVTTYSSAIYNFVPKFAIDFYNALRSGDNAFVINALNEFVIPYCNLRNKKQGYAVSIIKAGMTVIDRPAGPVRAPLTDLDAVELAELADLIKKVS